jgi:transcriptional regulator GlxA family with amidase domain
MPNKASQKSAKVAKKAAPRRVRAKAARPRKRVARSPSDPTKAAAEALESQQGEGPTGLHPELLRRLLRAKDRMDAASHEQWPVRRLARVSCVSEAHFARSFKEAFGVPPHRYLLTRRIERATALLRDTDLSITEIALLTGWESLGSFGRTFRDVTGESPGDFRAREKAAGHDLASVPECFLRAAHRPDLKIAVSEKRRRDEGRIKGTANSEVP